MIPASVSASPITIANNATLILYATGLNGATDVKVSLGGVDAPVLYAGAQGTWAGLEQINVTIPTSLVGKGRADIVVTAGGKKSNPVYINLQ